MLPFNSPFTDNLPNQVLQHESVATKLDFGVPGSVVLGKSRTAPDAAGGIRIPSLSMTIPLWPDSEAKSICRKLDIA